MDDFDSPDQVWISLAEKLTKVAALALGVKLAEAKDKGLPPKLRNALAEHYRDLEQPRTLLKPLSIQEQLVAARPTAAGGGESPFLAAAHGAAHLSD